MIYLDNAATSWPKPSAVLDAVMFAMSSAGGNPGRGGHNLVAAATDVVNETRIKLAKFFNIKSEKRIIFTSNATEALNLAILGKIKNSDHIIISNMEHNSVTRPIEYLIHSKNIRCTKVKTDKEDGVNPDDIGKAIEKNTKLIIMTHASNVTGTVNNIREIGRIAKEREIPFLVDASQTAGILPIDVFEDNIDLLAFPGHKGLLGSMGTGGLYIGDNINLEPIKFGGTGVYSEERMQPKELPFRFESGTLNMPGIAGLGKGIDFINETKIENIKNHELTLTEKLLDELLLIKGIKIYGSKKVKNRVSTISFNVADIDASDVAAILDSSFNIAVRSGLHCAPDAHRAIDTFNEGGTVRVSPGFFNDEKDIKTFLDAIIQIKNI
jgi:cysteine desulfurase family protein